MVEHPVLGKHYLQERSYGQVEVEVACTCPACSEHDGVAGVCVESLGIASFAPLSDLYEKT
jgi:hypothetical protein